MTEVVQSDVCCANCGIAEVDDIKLKECDGCDLVKYCSDKCREDHREQHEEECKKRKAKLHDKKLFRQPDGSHLGECPLCFLPMPLDMNKYTMKSCCIKTVCDGCLYVHHVRNRIETCPFCREPGTGDDEECKRRMMKRVKANDPAALREKGTETYEGGDWDIAIEYWTKAAELGDPEAHYQLSTMYHQGRGVEKDEEREVYYLEKAAMDGHHQARYNLGCYESRNGNFERSVKHFIIAANLGDEVSMKALWKYYSAGAITKEELEATLRTHKAAIDETKSEDRDLVEKSLMNGSRKIWVE